MLDHLKLLCDNYAAKYAMSEHLEVTMPGHDGGRYACHMIQERYVMEVVEEHTPC